MATARNQLHRAAGLSEGPIHRVMIVFNPNGRSNGQAFVDFGSSQDAEHAMSLDRQMFGNRYLEVRPPAHTLIFGSASAGLARFATGCSSHTPGQIRGVDQEWLTEEGLLPPCACCFHICSALLQCPLLVLAQAL